MPNYEDFLIALNHSLTSMMPDFTPFNHEDNGMVWGYGAFRDKIVDMISSISFKEERLALAQKWLGARKAADILGEAVKNSGLFIELVPTASWDESVELARKRECDIFSLAMKTPERGEYMDFTAPYVSYPFVIATLADELFIDDVKSLEGKRLAVLKGYAAAELFRDLYPYLTIVEIGSLMEGIGMVRSGEVFGYIDALPALTSVIQKEGMTEIRISGKFDEEWELSIAARNDEPLLVVIMQKALDSVDPDTVGMINNKWLAVLYDSRIDYSLLYKVLIGFWRRRVLSRVKQTIEEKNDQLRKAYEKYSWLAENMDDVVWVMGIDGRLIYIEPLGPQIARLYPRRGSCPRVSKRCSVRAPSAG